MTQNVLTISQINEYIRDKMERDPLLGSVAVKGEISNYKMYPSGHHYFTLKDEGGALKCVVFKSSALRLRFRPENGMQVIAMGKISVYPRDGAYQLYCSGMVIDGIGDLYAAFEQMKAKLAAKGLFDAAHKKPIPKYPQTIGIITSEAGAAVHDMLRILNKRYPLVKVRLLPVRVQGVEAPPEIAAAIAYANHHRLADVLIVGRGGGSIEDLWAFNEEIVAYAIYRSEIPVISAVGHEPDVTIADYVADLRAATPSNAAELAVPDQDVLRQTLDTCFGSMVSAIMQRNKVARRHLQVLKDSPSMRSPVSYINQKRNTLSMARTQLIAAQKQILHLRRQRFISCTAKLDAMSPLKVLTRGYAMVQKDDGTVVRSVKQLATGDVLQISVSDGSFVSHVSHVKEKEYE